MLTVETRLWRLWLVVAGIKMWLLVAGVAAGCDELKNDESGRQLLMFRGRAFGFQGDAEMVLDIYGEE